MALSSPAWATAHHSKAHLRLLESWCVGALIPSDGPTFCHLPSLPLVGSLLVNTEIQTGSLLPALLRPETRGDVCVFWGDYHTLQVLVSGVQCAHGFESATSLLPIRSGGVWLYNSPSALSIRQWNSKFHRAMFQAGTLTPHERGLRRG